MRDVMVEKTNMNIRFLTKTLSISLLVLCLILIVGCSTWPDGTYELKTALGKTITIILDDKPSEFLDIPYYDGKVSGHFNGIWRYAEGEKEQILIYSWLSGSMYELQYRIKKTNDTYTATNEDGKIEYSLSKTK